MAREQAAVSERDLGVLVASLAGVDTTVGQQRAPPFSPLSARVMRSPPPSLPAPSGHLAEVALHLIARLQPAGGLILALGGGVLLKEECYACRVKRRLTSIARDAKVVRSVLPPFAGALLKGLASLEKSVDHQPNRKALASALIGTTEDSTH